MSTAKFTGVREMQEVTLADKATLVLTEEVISQIALLHNKVGNIEWSGIILYKVLEGDIKSPKDLVLEAYDVVPMNVGSSTYTEYEIDAEDDYSYDRWAEALIEGNKMGQIHTHHNMKAYFSGTDMSELHDNAPNHNYYLSLIVNHKDPTNWVAKIAICGTVTSKGSLHKEVKWNGADLGVVETKDQSIDEEVKTLFLVDVNIKTTAKEVEETEFTNRIDELIANSKKTAYYAGPGHFQRRGTAPVRPQGKQTQIQWEDIHGLINSPDILEEDEDDGIPLKRAVSLREPGEFAPSKVLPFLLRLLSGCYEKELPSDMTLDSIILTLEDLSTSSKEETLCRIDVELEEQAEIYFKTVLDDVDLHCIAVVIEQILDVYTNSKVVQDFLDVVIDSYILDTNTVSLALQNNLTKELIYEE